MNSTKKGKKEIKKVMENSTTFFTHSSLQTPCIGNITFFFLKEKSVKTRIEFNN